MQTNFSLVQLADKGIAEADEILRTCVHCGFCTATCPTYVLLGDELDSPRGRIYQIKDTLEAGRPAGEDLVKHVDRCLSCLSCVTTCPSGVDYMHLVDFTRGYIERTHKRKFADKIVRVILASILPDRKMFRLALSAASFVRPFRKFFGRKGLQSRIRAMLELAPSKLPRRSVLDTPRVHEAMTVSKGRVILMSGCAQPVLEPGINDATIRLLTRLGYEVVIARGEGCCGALVQHMGKEQASRQQAQNNINIWWNEQQKSDIDAIVITASGCGTNIKDYGHMFRNQPDMLEKAKWVSNKAMDVSEFLENLDVPKQLSKNLVVAYHSACSMQHGQQINSAPVKLLSKAGFTVKAISESHLCCGSAGVYNILQPRIASRLRDRKLKNIHIVQPDIIATGNIGCITQLAGGTDVPVVHTVELLDWASGGPKPKKLSKLAH